MFLQTLILLFVIEGICFAMFPRQLARAMLELCARGETALRSIGVTALIFALILFCLLRFIY